VVTGAKS